MYLCCWYKSQSLNSLFLYKALIFISNLHPSRFNFSQFGFSLSFYEVVAR